MFQEEPKTTSWKSSSGAGEEDREGKHQRGGKTQADGSSVIKIVVGIIIIVVIIVTVIAIIIIKGGTSMVARPKRTVAS